MRQSNNQGDSVTVLHVLTVASSIGFFDGAVEGMRDRGFSLQFATSDDGTLHQIAKRIHAPIHPIPLSRRIDPFQDLKAVISLCRVIRTVRPGIVHAHTPKGGLVGMISATLMRVPVRYYHVHGLPMVTAIGAKRRLLKWSELIATRLAHQVLAVGDSIRDVAIQEGLCRPGRIDVISEGTINGIDALGRFNPEEKKGDMRKEIREELGIDQSAIVVGFVGRLARDKGVGELVEAWSSKGSEHQNAILLLIGPDEENDPIGPKSTNEIGADPTIIRIGMRYDIERYYAAMDVFVLPSYREGFPISPMEAASMGLPVIATRIPGCIDAVIDSKTGTLVEARSASALSEALSMYIGNEYLRMMHGNAGRERVLKDFVQGRIWDEMKRSYEGWLSKVRVTRGRPEVQL